MALFSACQIAAPCGIKIDYNYNFGYNFNFNNTSCISSDHLYPTNLIPAANHKRLRRSRSLTSIPQTTTIRSYRRFNHARAEAAETMETAEILEIKIIHNPPETKLADLGVRSWPKWGCPPSKFPWTYSSKETCYLLKGKVKVYPDKFNEAVEIGAGDLVVFPKGMSCTWDVSEAVDKHYTFQ